MEIKIRTISAVGIVRTREKHWALKNIVSGEFQDVG
jgi:hypothetical protein